MHHHQARPRMADRLDGLKQRAQVVDFVECLRDDDIVKLVVKAIDLFAGHADKAQPAMAFSGFVYQALIQIDADPGGGIQGCEQITVTTADFQHATAWFDDAGEPPADALVIVMGFPGSLIGVHDVVEAGDGVAPATGRILTRS